MKVKLIDKEPFYLAGIVDNGECKKRKKPSKHIFIHTQKIKDSECEAKEKTEETEEKTEEAYANDQSNEETNGYSYKKSINIELPDMNEAMQKLGDIVGNMGKHIEKNAPGWERDIKDFGNNFEVRMEKFGDNMDEFGKKMDGWGEEFGEKMEAWGKNFGKKMEAWGDDLSKHMDSFGDNTEANWSHIWEAGEEDDIQINTWLKQYPAYETYRKVYEEQLSGKESIINRKSFYEVQILESNSSDTKSMVMFASRLSELIPLNHPVVLMTYDPDRWVVVKVTHEEYKKDWLGRLADLELLEGYEIEPYFIIKHNKKDPEKLIKIYCPLKENTYEG